MTPDSRVQRIGQPSGVVDDLLALILKYTLHEVDSLIPRVFFARWRNGRYHNLFILLSALTNYAQGLWCSAHKRGRLLYVS